MTNRERIQANNEELRKSIELAESLPEFEEVELYEGEYIVTPTVSNQTMATKNKLMINDVTIEAIPYAEVTNNSGGTTVSIG